MPAEKYIVNFMDEVNGWLQTRVGWSRKCQRYQLEIDRLFWWPNRLGVGSLDDLTSEHMLRYEEFLGDPFRGEHPPLHLFTGPLNLRLRKEALQIIAELFEYLVRRGMLRHNPLEGMLRIRPQRYVHRLPSRLIDNEVRSEVVRSVEDLPRELPEDEQYFERARWIVRLLLETKLPST
jgi:site-specific recombinase XerD